MNNLLRFALILTAVLALPTRPAQADDFDVTLSIFRNSGESAKYFKKAYGYAVFPTVGKGGFVVGGAFGRGQVYVGGKVVGTSKLTQVSVGFQAGGQAYSEIVFFQDKQSYERFASGNFQFGAEASATALTAGASAKAGSSGISAGASGTNTTATTAGAGYNNGMAIFTVVKGGLMYEASVGGQKFSFEPAK